jgi:hypothetical protein
MAGLMRALGKVGAFSFCHRAHLALAHFVIKMVECPPPLTPQKIASLQTIAASYSPRKGPASPSGCLAAGALPLTG